jgi:hypothetical protein
MGLPVFCGVACPLASLCVLVWPAGPTQRIESTEAFGHGWRGYRRMALRLPRTSAEAVIPSRRV